MNIRSNFKFLLLLLSLVSIAFIVIIQSTGRSFTIQFDQSHGPLIRDSFHGRDLYFLIDTGATNGISLYQEDLEKVTDKKIINTVFHRFFNGCIEKVHQYQLQNVNILGFKFDKMNCNQLPQNYDDLVSLQKESISFEHDKWDTKNKVLDTSRHGVLGLDFLKNYNFILDLKKDKISFLEKNFLGSLKSLEFLFSRKIPFIIDPQIGITLHVSTPIGMKTFLLDTGSSYNVIADSKAITKHPIDLHHKYFDSTQIEYLKVGDTDLGRVQLDIIPEATLSDYDGILGIDFLCQKKVLFNMEYNYICIK